VPVPALSPAPVVKNLKRKIKLNPPTEK